MTKSTFFHLLLLSVHLAIKSVESVCPIDCSTYVPPISKTADPYDCTQYYECIDANTHSITPSPCPPGESFQSGACAPGLPCKPLCGFCHLTCDPLISGDIIADPVDCSSYRVCLPTGGTVPEICPAHIPYFDSSTLMCTDNPDGCCVPNCSPYCEALDGRLVPDPEDCAKYYACTSAPFPQFACPAGENFDIVYGTCSPVGACVVLCP